MWCITYMSAGASTTPEPLFGAALNLQILMFSAVYITKLSSRYPLILVPSSAPGIEGEMVVFEMGNTTQIVVTERELVKFSVEVHGCNRPKQRDNHLEFMYLR
eukprot:SAG11_NODE_4388_length_1918_cov_1.721825_2_plen_103_part_00